MADTPTDQGARLEKFMRRIRKKVRFAAESETGKRSGVWSAWGNNSDFYIGARPLLKKVRISLHASGICRVAFTEQHIQRLSIQGTEVPEDRAFIKWRKPETPERGASHVVSVIFPTQSLNLERKGCGPGKPLLLLNAGRGVQAVEMGFFFTRLPDDIAGEEFEQIGKPQFYVTLENGDRVWLVARATEFDPKCLPITGDGVQHFRSKYMNPDAIRPGEERENLNFIFWSDPKDGDVLRIVEIGGVTVRRKAAA